MKFNGFLFLLELNLPLAPIAMLVGFIVLLPVSIMLNKSRIKHKRKIYREAIIKVENIKSFHTILYLILCSLLFLVMILLVVIKAIS